MRLTIYRLLSFLLVLDFVLIILLLTLGKMVGSIIVGLLFLAILAVQVIIVKCPNRGTRPGIDLRGPAKIRDKVKRRRGP